jgi:hypothetical protein
MKDQALILLPWRRTNIYLAHRERSCPVTVISVASIWPDTKNKSTKCGVPSYNPLHSRTPPRRLAWNYFFLVEWWKFGQNFVKTINFFFQPKQILKFFHIGSDILEKKNWKILPSEKNHLEVKQVSLLNLQILFFFDNFHSLLTINRNFIS